MKDPFGSVSGTGLDLGFVGGFVGGFGGGLPSGAAAALDSHSALAAWLAGRGHRVHGLAADPDAPLAAGEAPPAVRSVTRDDGVVVRLVQPVTAGDSGSSAPGRSAIDPVVLAWLAETPCDLVHVFDLAGLGAAALEAVADVGQPFVATLHQGWEPTPELLHALGRCHRVFAAKAEREAFRAAGFDDELFADLTDPPGLERAYVEVIRDVTGLEPDLIHPLEGSGSVHGGDASGPKPPAPPPGAGRSGSRRGFLGRLFGR